MSERENTTSLTGQSAADWKAQYPELFTAQTPRQLIRTSFQEAFTELGAKDFLVAFARESEANRRVFVAALARFVPLEVQLSAAAGTELTIKIESYADDRQTRTLKHDPRRGLIDITDAVLVEPSTSDKQSGELDAAAIGTSDEQGNVDHDASDYVAVPPKPEGLSHAPT